MKLSKMLWVSLKIVVKVTLFMLQAFAALACDERPKSSRYSANKAYDLYKSGDISGAEYAKSIHGD